MRGQNSIDIGAGDAASDELDVLTLLRRPCVREPRGRREWLVHLRPLNPKTIARYATGLLDATKKVLERTRLVRIDLPFRVERPTPRKRNERLVLLNVELEGQSHGYLLNGGTSLSWSGSNFRILPEKKSIIRSTLSASLYLSPSFSMT